MKHPVTLSLLLLLSIPLRPADAKPAGKFDIHAWTFDRGNAAVYENPDIYADYRDSYPELVAAGNGKIPWVVEYDIDFPVDATYTIRIRYSAEESRPLKLWFDGRMVGECCAEPTTNTKPHPYTTRNPYYKPPKHAPVRRGAQWEEAAKLDLKAGKHTLKLTRDGQPPNLLSFRFESPVKFPKGWSHPPPGPMTKIDRLPATYRRAFLEPGSVNVATLRSSIEDMISEFGSRYPKGTRYLDKLSELEKKQDAAHELDQLRRDAMLSHPLLDFDKLLFVKRITYTSSHIYSDHWDGSRKMGGNLCILSPVEPDGEVTELVPQLSGGLFGRYDLTFDGKKVVFSYKKDKDKGYRIYEIGVDGKGLRRLTHDCEEETRLQEQHKWNYRFEDYEPCCLPNGRIMFASTRSKRRVFCFGSTVTTLYVMDADGKNMRCVSEGPINEMSPCVMDDGRVIYTRWEYVDKGFGNVQSLWSMRPDGSHSAHVYKSDVILPAGMINARSIPGSRRLVTIGAPHCGLSVGPVILVDNRKDRRTAVSMTNITPELGYPGMSPHRSGRTFGYFKEPWPLSEKFFIVSHNPRGSDREPKGYGIYVLDALGNRAQLYRDPELSCFQPMPLRPRKMPTVIASVEMDHTEKQNLATIFMHDVYRGMTGIEKGRVKFVRVMEAIGTSWDDGWRSNKQKDGAGLQASAVSLKGDVNIKKIHGIATVHEDGSALFTVPAGKNIFFQALDEDYMELQRMRSFLNLMPGEKRSCVGCHERRQLAPDAALGRSRALDCPVEKLRPQPGDSGPRVVHYARDIRPILDKHCVGCHGSQDPKGGLDLTGELTKLYDRSYENFINKSLVGHLNDGFGAANVAPEPPLTFGSHQSRLVRRIRKDPCKSKLTREEFIRIVTWVDADAPYFGTHRGKKNLKWKDDPEFRPMPQPGE